MSRRRFTSGRGFSAPSTALAARSRGAPAELTQQIATTQDGRDITRQWLGELEEFRDRRLLGAVDWGAYDRILLDDQVKSCLEQRRSAVVSREWSVLSGAPGEKRADAAAEALEGNLERLDWDGITDKMLYGPFHGIAHAELIWAYRAGLIEFADIKVRHARRFRYDRDGRLRLITMQNMRGEIMPERKFWTVKVGASDDDQPYGRGLAEWLYWPTLFKRNGIRFWNIFLDKFSIPPVKGVYPRGTSKEEIAKLLQSMMALANDSGIAVPEGVVLEFMQVATAGIDFEKMPAYMDEAIAKIILSQTMTTQDGSSLAQGKVHAGVKQELITADADLLCGSFNRGPARWFTDLNFGEDVAAPIVVRQVDEETDLKATAETDKVLAEIGWERTPESFSDLYGDGFERKAPPAPGNAPPGATAPPKAANDQAGEEAGRKAANFAAEDLRSLYVYRRLKNAQDLLAWAKKAGFKSTLPAAELHVTITFSRRPVNWFAMGRAFGPPAGELVVPAGGPRRVEPMGDKGAVALVFGDPELEWRHKEMVEAGAGWDHADYFPHLTLTHDGGDVDLTAIEPYQGKLVFGPETFEAIDEGWADRIAEVCFAEQLAGDLVDVAVDEIMADEGWTRVADDLGATALVERLKDATTVDEIDSILRREAELGEDGALAERLGRAGFAVRMAGATGTDMVDA